MPGDERLVPFSENEAINDQHVRSEKDIFRFQVTVNEMCFFQNAESIEKLSGKDFHELSAETLELILFDQFVKILGEQLENKT